MRRFAAVFAITATALAGCSNFPELDAAVTPAARTADFPSLVPISPLIAGAQQVQITEETVATLQGRVSGLKARAARLRGPIIDGATRARMQAAMARHR